MHSLEPVGVIVFGSPCQDLSCAGKRAGIVDGKASQLFWEAVRIVGEMATATRGLYPRVAIWENVAGAFSSTKGRDFEIAIDSLARIETSAGRLFRYVEWGTLRASYFGYPHKRERVFVMAYRTGRGFGELRQPSGGGGQSDGGGGDMDHAKDDYRRAGIGDVADTGSGQLQEPRRGSDQRTGPGSAGEIFSDAGGKRLQGKREN